MWKQHELWDGTYTLDDLLDAAELIRVRRENETRAAEAVRSKARSGTFCGYGNISVFQFGMKIDFFRLFGYNHFQAKEK